MTDPKEPTGLSTNANGGQLFSIGGQLDVSDVLSVATSRAEAKLAKTLAEAKRELKNAEKDAKDADKALTAAISAQSDSIAETLAENVEKGVEALGGNVERSTNDALGHHGKDKGRVTGSITISQNSGSNRGYGCQFSNTEDPNEAVTAAQEANEAAQGVRATAQERALEVRRQLNNIPLLERQYRAKIAEAKLQDSEEGQQLLDVMTQGLDDDILALPSH